MKTAFYYDEWCFWHSTAGQYAQTFAVRDWVQPPSAVMQAESPETKRRFKNLIEMTGLSKHLYMSSAVAASDEDLLRIHSPDYLEQFKALSDAGGGVLGPEAAMGPNSFEIAKLSAGLACAALENVWLGIIKNAYALCRPPGHHCLPDQAMGFCFLANAAIAIEYVKAKYAIKKIAVVDWDAHHGNGSQQIFYDRDDVLTISLHQENCFPAGYSGAKDQGQAAGQGFNLNIPLQPGCGHHGYLYAFEKIVIPAIQRYQPEMIIVASGFDANAFDPLARMQLHSESYRVMTALMMQLAEECCHHKLVMLHEGGYAEVYVPFCGLRVMEQLSGVSTAFIDPALEFIQKQQPSAAFDLFQMKLLDDLAMQFDLTSSMGLSL